MLNNNGLKSLKSDRTLLKRNIFYLPNMSKTTSNVTLSRNNRSIQPKTALYKLYNKL